MEFFREFLRSPVKVGSICPSSPFLTRALVDSALAGGPPRGLFVDLGAGSGVVSRQLLNHGVAPDHILAIDISEQFITLFNKRSPEIDLHIGDARNLSKIIAASFPLLPVAAVISSLPLRNMPLAVISEIMREIRGILCRHHGILIQYTYALWIQSFLESFGFFKISSHYVMCNLPPALVETYYPVS